MANTYTAATLTPYNYDEAQQKIADEYSAKLAAEQQALKDTYDQNALTQQAANAKIPAAYQTQANQAAAKSEQNRAAFNEYASKSGINSGVGSQANLAQTNALQGNLTTIRGNEANAVSAGDLAVAKLKTDYQNGIAQALATNDYQKATALMDAWNSAESSRVSTESNQAAQNYQATEYNNTQLQNIAQTLAQYGDFSGYKALGYTDDEVDAMQSYWNAKNGVSSSSSSSSSSSRRSSGTGSTGSSGVSSTGSGTGSSNYANALSAALERTDAQGISDQAKQSQFARLITQYYKQNLITADQYNTYAKNYGLS